MREDWVMRKFFGLVVAAILLTGCSSGDHHDSMDMPAATPGSAYSSTDLMFAEMMIPHHQQALVMSELALTRSTNADVLALAQEIRAAQEPEIEQMKSWGATGEEHAGHQMDGMLSDEELAALEAASGAEFDRLFLEGMIKHHQGAIDMAQMVLASENAEAKALGESIVATQQAEIKRMQELLQAIGS